MTKRRTRRALWINVVGVLVALVVAVLGFSRRFDEGVPEVWAKAPAPAPANSQGALVDAGVPHGPGLDPGSDAARAAMAAADAGAVALRDAVTVDPIDLAVAPDGGVPHHPSGTPYRSPFARPSSEKAVRVKVGMLLNSVD